MSTNAVEINILWLSHHFGNGLAEKNPYQLMETLFLLCLPKMIYFLGHLGPLLPAEYHTKNNAKKIIAYAQLDDECQNRKSL